jgi:ABC-type multidrug transport system fused ATPase/permease subunit
LFIAPISTILNKVFYLFLTIAGLTYIDPIISLILFGILFFYYFAAYILLKRIAKKNSISRSEKFESILKIVDDTIGNFQFLKISNLIKKENERFKKTTSNSKCL